MRVAALYDVHGNLPALEAVLADVDEARVDLIVVGGDIASGPMPAETLALVRSRGACFIRGNADRVLDFAGNDGGDPEVWKQARYWVAERLGEEALAFLGGLPLDETIEVDGSGPVRFCHGAPGSDEEAITSATPDERLRGLLAGVEERTVVCGHTHMQFDRVVDCTRVVNAGSVGAPYEARPGAYWLLAGPRMSLRRTDYDVKAAVERIVATGYPKRDELVGYLLGAEPERPARMARLIEFGN